MKTILILVDNFFPAYKGGGPIQSINNLVKAMDGYRVYVVTAANDLGETSLLPGIQPDQWSRVTLPGDDKEVNVWYGDKSRPGFSVFKKMLNDIRPSVIYFNGIFSYNLFMRPLMAIKSSKTKPMIVICPRGMLQKGALADKSFKKKIYLQVLKASGLVKNARWHATNEEEQQDILKYFPANRGVVVAPNIPKEPVEKVNPIQKVPGNLRLVYLSLIAEKKNLLYLLQLLKATEKITLDIYGPVKDRAYWEQCLPLVNEMNDKVKYCGNVLPAEVQQTFQQYHCGALLTRGENFGHALYECLSSGRPVITSYFTPWDHLDEHKAGWNMDIANFASCISSLNKIKELDQEQFTEYCFGAYKMAKEYFSGSNKIDNYEKLYSVS